jgi:type IV secretory pathway TraG/TraD family ATPase VirD4
LDKRCVGWTIFNDLETTIDIQALAASLIPAAAGNTDPFWNGAARDVFTGILSSLWRDNYRSNRGIWNSLTAPIEEIAEMIHGVAGGEATVTTAGTRMVSW